MFLVLSDVCLDIHVLLSSVGVLLPAPEISPNYWKPVLL